MAVVNLPEEMASPPVGEVWRLEDSERVARLEKELRELMDRRGRIEAVNNGLLETVLQTVLYQSKSAVLESLDDDDRDDVCDRLMYSLKEYADSMIAALVPYRRGVPVMSTKTHGPYRNAAPIAKVGAVRKDR